MQNKKKQNKILDYILITMLIIALFCIIIFAFSRTVNISFADSSTYIKAPISDLKANEYAQKSSIMVSTDEDSFYIPESYYVEIKSKAFNNTYYANYMGLDCYITLNDASFVTPSESSTIFPQTPITIKDDQTVTLNSNELNLDYLILFMGYSEDSTKAYCKATKAETTIYGFIDINKLNPINVVYETSSQIERNNIISQEEFNPNDELQASTSKGIRIAIIVCLAVAAVIITISLFINKKKERHTSIKDDGPSYDEPTF